MSALRPAERSQIKIQMPETEAELTINEKINYKKTLKMKMSLHITKNNS